MAKITKIAPCLWFDHQAEDAARFYTSIFKNARIVAVTHYGDAGHDVHRKPAGSVMTVTFELEGQSFTALNGGPAFTFSEAISFLINCQSQEEIDYFWEKLSEGGDPNAQQCGWLKDKFGISWQIIPNDLLDMLNSPETEKSQRAMHAMLKMKKLDLAELRRAFEGV